MKKLALITLIVASSSVYAAETKQICTDIKDKNGYVILDTNGIAKQTCRVIIVHKKYEGTVVPTKPLTPTPYGFDPIVKKRQLELIAVGAKITADGITGPATRRAEAEFGYLVLKK